MVRGKSGLQPVRLEPATSHVEYYLLMHSTVVNDAAIMRRSDTRDAPDTGRWNPGEDAGSLRRQEPERSEREGRAPQDRSRNDGVSRRRRSRERSPRDTRCAACNNLWVVKSCNTLPLTLVWKAASDLHVIQRTEMLLQMGTLSETQP